MRSSVSNSILRHYHALAIIDFMNRSNGDIFQKDVQNDYSGEQKAEGVWNLLPSNVLFGKSLTWLIQSGLIELTEDNFGPALIQKSEDFDRNWEQIQLKKDLPFYKYGRIPLANSSGLPERLSRRCVGPPLSEKLRVPQDHWH